MHTEKLFPLKGDHIPIHADAEYPALLRELAEVVERELRSTGCDADQASAVAETVTEHVRERFGGVPNYWPKGSTWRHRKRLAAMWADFNGRNHTDLAQKYGMCVQRVYFNLAVYRREIQAKQQPGLFDQAAAAHNAE